MCVRAAPTGHASIGHLLMVAEQVSDSRGGRNTLHAANNTLKRSRVYPSLTSYAADH